MNARPSLVVVPLVLAALAGCGGGGGDDFHYFDAKPYKTPACNGAGDSRLAFRRELNLFTNRNSDVPPYSQALQRYYHRHGLTFFSEHEVTTVPQSYAIDSNDSDLEAALIKQFPGVNLDDKTLQTRDPELYQSILSAAVNFMFHPLLEFVRAHSAAGTGVTNMVVVPSVVRPGGQDVAAGDVAGLAISPALLTELTAEGEPGAEIWKSIALPKDFSPVMFLDGKVLAVVSSVAPDLVDLVVAHEFGHTGGLVHRMEDHNLMFPYVDPDASSCTDSLDPDQIETMRGTFGLGQPLRVREAPAAPARPSAAISFEDLRALRHGDRAALRRLLQPFVN
jgi:hypothetical protein